MKTELNQRWMCVRNRVRSLIVASCVLGVAGAMAQTTIVSTDPADGATGVSTTAGVVFTFSAAMDPDQTTAEFFTLSPFAVLTTTPAWSAGNTVLTCTPSPAFPISSSITWVVDGQDAEGSSLSGIPEGMFTTGTSTNGGGGGGNTGFGTNKYTSFVVGKAVSFDQLSAGSPTIDTNYPYGSFASIVLASNRTAALATLTLPNASVTNFFQNPVEPDQFYLFDSFTNQTELDAAFAPGNYAIALTGGNSNVQVTINLPASWTQPNPPHVSNFAATQTVDPTKALTLSWDAFSGGTAKDFISIIIGDDSSGDALSSNFLAGTATSVVIPANTFAPGVTYDGNIAFLHLAGATNVAGVYTTAAYVETVTQFSLITTNGASGVIPTPPTFSSPSVSGHTINFTVNTAANQNVTIQYNTQGLLPSGWQTLMTTNNSLGVIQVSDAINAANKSVFYRAVIAP